MAEREKKGFFLLEDKSKSTDPQNAKLFKPKKAKQGADEEEEADEEEHREAGDIGGTVLHVGLIDAFLE